MKPILALILALPSYGQILSPILFGPSSGGGGGGGTFAIVDHTSQAQTGAFNATITTPSINSTGANICWVAISNYSNAVPSLTVTDSKSNTYTAVSMTTGAGNIARVGIWYSKVPTVGSGHTVTVTGSYYGAVAFMCASGSITTGGADQEIDAVPTAATTAQAGSVTPTNTNQIVLAAISIASDAPTPTISSIGSGFTLVENVAPVANTSYALGFGYLIQTTATAVNPPWALSGTPAFNPHLINVTFKSH